MTFKIIKEWSTKTSTHYCYLYLGKLPLNPSPVRFHSLITSDQPLRFIVGQLEGKGKRLVKRLIVLLYICIVHHCQLFVVDCCLFSCGKEHQRLHPRFSDKRRWFLLESSNLFANPSSTQKRRVASKESSSPFTVLVLLVLTNTVYLKLTVYTNCFVSREITHPH